MSSNLLEEESIFWQPNDYVLFQKCGEIIVSPDIQKIGFNCLFCMSICLQDDIFLQHLQEQHKEDVYKLYENQNSNKSCGDLNEMVVNISDINLKEDNLNTVIALNNIHTDNIGNSNGENKEEENCVILNTFMSGEITTSTTDLNPIYNLETKDLLTLIFSNQEIENLITIKPLENLDITNISTNTTTTTITTSNSLASYTNNFTTPLTSTSITTSSSTSQDCFKCVTDDNEYEIGDGEDSGIMLVQSPCNSDCSRFSDCMSFTEDNSSKSPYMCNENLENLTTDFTKEYTPSEIFNNTQQETSQSLKSKYINTPAMRKALNNREIVAYLLEAYEKSEKFWNPQHPSYKYNAHRTTYSELSQPLLHDMNYSLTGIEIFGIINQLRGRYRRELAKFEARRGKHKTRLWYFEKMEFLRKIIEEKRKERNRGKEEHTKTGVVGDKDLTNRQVLSYLLELYRQYECLWNPNDLEYDTCNKSEIYEVIAEQLWQKLNIKMTHTECVNEIKKLLIRYRKELRILHKLKGLYIPKLWCFDEMEFLKPQMEDKIRKKVKKTVNHNASTLSQRKHDFLNAEEIKFSKLEQQLQFIEIYRNYISLWDVEHPDYRSTNYRTKALSKMLEEVKLTFSNNTYQLPQLEKTLYVLRKDFSAEKLKRIMASQSKKQRTPSKDMSFVLYEKLNQFLCINLGPFRCDNCQKICRTYDQYKIHKSKHDGTLPFICTLCGKSFKMPGNLTIHIRRHRRDFPYSCKVCKKSFATSTEVNIHMRSHTGERPYICEWCNKTFKTWSFYTLHKRTHLNQSNFHCPICDKSFYERNRFTDHMNIHLNIRKHQCKKCDKSFTTIGNLKKHLDLHEPIGRYKCEICGKRFAQMASLHWHRKTQHEQ